jgi:hypothetical protein
VVAGLAERTLKLGEEIHGPRGDGVKDLVDVRTPRSSTRSLSSGRETALIRFGTYA